MYMSMIDKKRGEVDAETERKGREWRQATSITEYVLLGILKITSVPSGGDYAGEEQGRKGGRKDMWVEREEVRSGRGESRGEPTSRWQLL